MITDKQLAEIQTSLDMYKSWGGVWPEAGKIIELLLVEMAALRPDAKLGAAVRRIPWNTALQRGGICGQEQWMMIQGGAYLGWYDTPEEALSSIGCMYEVAYEF